MVPCFFSGIVRRTYAAEILFGLLMLILSSAWVLVFMEEGIASYKDALWYCFALVTTIGFGDITAVTDLGRTMSVVLGVYGIIVVALITSIIVNFYGEIKKTRPEEETEADNADLARREPHLPGLQQKACRRNRFK